MGKLTQASAWLLVGLAVLWTAFTITDRMTHRRTPTAPYRTIPGIGEQLQGGHKLLDEPGGIRVIVFSDYQCPACKELMGRLDEIRRDKDVSLSIVLRHFPIPSHPYAFKAAVSAEC